MKKAITVLMFLNAVFISCSTEVARTNDSGPLDSKTHEQGVDSSNSDGSMIDTTVLDGAEDHAVFSDASDDSGIVVDSGSDATLPKDQGTDQSVKDAASDSKTDAAQDAAIDTKVDTAIDTHVDTKTDTATDTAVDVKTDTATDIAVDTKLDTTSDTATDTTTDTSPDSSVGGTGPAATVVKALGRSPHFLIGMGNDLAGAADNWDHNKDGAYTLGVTLDLHYAYLVGTWATGGWSTWNSGGWFVNILTDSADNNGVTPMFTLYAMAGWGEGNLGALTSDAYMGPYWDDAKLLFERLAYFGKPAVVHFEPDFWAFAQQNSPNNDPAQLAVKVSSLAPDCASLPNTMEGMGKCLIKLARTYAPKVIIGFHASRWAGSVSNLVAYLNKLGANQADIIVIETLDRDAGCFEAHTDSACQRNDGPWYWDETNQTSPNFHEHLAWAKQINQGIGKPVLWWQMPFGVPSTTPGGSAGKYRDNRVKYLFNHVDEFVAAGGVGAVFGTGAGNQTYITSDGGQFKNAVTKYFQNPFMLP